MHESHQINHQESPERVREVLKLLQEGRFMNWASSEIRWAKDFPLATPRQALRVHTRKYLELVELLSRQASISGRAMPFTPVSVARNSEICVVYSNTFQRSNTNPHKTHTARSESDRTCSRLKS